MEKQYMTGLQFVEMLLRKSELNMALEMADDTPIVNVLNTLAETLEIAWKKNKGNYDFEKAVFDLEIEDRKKLTVKCKRCGLERNGHEAVTSECFCEKNTRVSGFYI